MQNIESDEISLKELIEKGKEWFAYLLSMEDYFISWNRRGCSRFDLFFIKKTRLYGFILLEKMKSLAVLGAHRFS
jgi:hypothetical protein